MPKKEMQTLMPGNHGGNFQTVTSDARSEYSGIRGGGRNMGGQFVNNERVHGNFAQGPLPPGHTGARANTIHRLIGPNQ